MNFLKLSDTQYDFLSRVVKYGLPAIGTFYAAIASIWGFGYVEHVLASVVALETVLGVWIGISKFKFDREPAETDGDIVYDEDVESFQLHLNKLPAEVAEKGYGLFEITKGRYGEYPDA